MSGLMIFWCGMTMEAVSCSLENCDCGPLALILLVVRAVNIDERKSNNKVGKLAWEVPPFRRPPR